MSSVPPVSGCTGQDVAVELRVSGGEPPYEWLPTRELPPGLSLIADASDTAHLRGTLSDAGEFVVGVVVKNGDACTGLEVPIVIRETPRITTVELAEACVGQSYQSTLAGEGGDPESYEWTIEGLPASLSQAQARLSGAAPSEAGTLGFQVSLRDRHCPALGAPPIVEDVEWSVKAAAECPLIDNVRLPRPCAGIDYSERLTASSGAGEPFSWRRVSEETELPAGLRFDEATGLLSGKPTTGGRLEVELLDALGQGARRSFDLSLRESCWLAYVSRDADGTWLHYRDALLTQDRRLPDELGPDEAVIDFAFSPDGTRLVFRVGAAERGRLLLFSAEEPEQPAIPLGFDCPDAPLGASCAVLDYAWSDDSRHLAVMLDGNGVAPDALSGVELDEPERRWPARSVDLYDTPIEYSGQLAWVSSSHVAFAGVNPINVGEIPYVAVLGPVAAETNDVGFDRPKPMYTLESGAMGLRKSPTGVFVLNGSVALRHLEIAAPAAEEDWVVTAGAWLSPDGRYVATTTPDASLRVFLPHAAEQEWLAESAPGVCGTIVAWADPAPDRQQLLCSGIQSAATGGGPTWDDLHVLTFAEDRAAISAALIPKDEYDPMDLTASRRAFSTAASWLFLGPPMSKLIDVSQPLPSVRWGSLPAETAMDIEFAPDGGSLLLFSEYSISYQQLWPIDAAPVEVQRADDFVIGRLVPAGCQEDYYRAPDLWCGASRPAKHFAWSSDSTVLLFEDASGKLWISDLSAQPIRPPQPLSTALAPCSGTATFTWGRPCIPAYAFQPRP